MKFFSENNDHWFILSLFNQTYIELVERNIISIQFC
jgi:hypothetical protein